MKATYTIRLHGNNVYTTDGVGVLPILYALLKKGERFTVDVDGDLYADRFTFGYYEDEFEPEDSCYYYSAENDGNHSPDIAELVDLFKYYVVEW